MTDVVRIVPTDRSTGTLTVVIGASRFAKLAWLAADKGVSVNAYASDLLADLIDDDAKAHGEGE